MKLFEVTNGWCGNSYVRILCVSESEEEALELTTPKFKEDGRNNDPSYWLNLEVKVLCEDVSKSWCGDVVDD